jgi:hypothetical protein
MRDLNACFTTKENEAFPLETTIHTVAADVDRVEVFDRRVCVASSTRSTVVGRGADAFEEALVHAVDEDALIL